MVAFRREFQRLLKVNRGLLEVAAIQERNCNIVVVVCGPKNRTSAFVKFVFASVDTGFGAGLDFLFVRVVRDQFVEPLDRPLVLLRIHELDAHLISMHSAGELFGSGLRSRSGLERDGLGTRPRRHFSGRGFHFAPGLGGVFSRLVVSRLARRGPCGSSGRFGFRGRLGFTLGLTGLIGLDSLAAGSF